MITRIKKTVPPLAAGDKLTREEFLRRWESHPEIKCAELLGGLVYMPSPVSVEHGDMDGTVGTWLGTYTARTPGTACGHNTTTFLLEDVPQPDLNLRILPQYGGSSRVEDGYLQGPAEFLAEICRSSASYDLHVKLDLYQKARVPEYLAVLIFEREIRWHVLGEEGYQLLSPDAAGVWRSQVFPGLWLDGSALLAGDLPRVLSRLDEGLASAEHKKFVEELARRRTDTRELRPR
jgi:hypothetical protein